MCKDKIDNLDCREFVLMETDEGEVIIYQAEMIRLISLLKNKNSGLAEKFKRIIYLRDKKEGTHSNIIETTKINIAKYVMSPRDYFEYLDSQKEIDGKIRVFYAAKKRK